MRKELRQGEKKMFETDLLPRSGAPGGEVEAGLTFFLSSAVTGHSEMSALEGAFQAHAPRRRSFPELQCFFVELTDGRLLFILRAAYQ